jgi:hypothetical protein
MNVTVPAAALLSDGSFRIDGWFTAAGQSAVLKLPAIEAPGQYLEVAYRPRSCLEMCGGTPAAACAADCAALPEPRDVDSTAWRLRTGFTPQTLSPIACQTRPAGQPGGSPGGAVLPLPTGGSGNTTSVLLVLDYRPECSAACGQLTLGGGLLPCRAASALAASCVGPSRRGFELVLALHGGGAAAGLAAGRDEWAARPVDDCDLDSEGFVRSCVVAGQLALSQRGSGAERPEVLLSLPAGAFGPPPTDGASGGRAGGLKVVGTLSRANCAGWDAPLELLLGAGHPPTAALWEARWRLPLGLTGGCHSEMLLDALGEAGGLHAIEFELEPWAIGGGALCGAHPGEALQLYLLLRWDAGPANHSGAQRPPPMDWRLELRREPHCLRGRLCQSGVALIVLQLLLLLFCLGGFGRLHRRGAFQAPEAARSVPTSDLLPDVSDLSNPNGRRHGQPRFWFWPRNYDGARGCHRVRAGETVLAAQLLGVAALCCAPGYGLVVGLPLVTMWLLVVAGWLRRQVAALWAWLVLSVLGIGGWLVVLLLGLFSMRGGAHWTVAYFVFLGAGFNWLASVVAAALACGVLGCSAIHDVRAMSDASPADRAQMRLAVVRTRHDGRSARALPRAAVGPASDRVSQVARP